ncbi:histone acetyltransferase KAT7 isoform X4 [Nothobranchius furzeri]|uniref:histone acetyltransferase KAT7 isoform X4 n=1 Tax=Nothobranchius furzeri TaxID=105023 RepID=UPI003904C366
MLLFSQRTAGSSSDGTEDSDFSTDLEHAAETAGRRSSTRLTRSSLRLSQSSQENCCSAPSSSPAAGGPDEGPDAAAAVAASVFSSGRRITRSQQGAANATAKKYPLRQSRSSGSDTEVNDVKQGADRDETPPRTPTGNAPSCESDIDASSPSVDHVSSGNDVVVSQEEDERLAKELSLKEAAAHDLSHRPKRRRFHESYNFNMKCPTPGCNSLGHLTGRHERHFSVSGCPLYHNLSADECKGKTSVRDKQAEERSQQQDESRHSTRSQAPTERQQRYKEKVTELRRKRNSGLNKEQKEKHTEHHQSHETRREPLLENITSDYDLELFRKAQARASEDLEKLRLAGQESEGSNMIGTIVFGRFELDTWYHSPYPEEYARLGRLYMCEFCLKYMKSQTILRRHMAKCVWKHPPGDEIYRKGNISVFEVDGKKNKEKNSFLNYNVSCILTMPQYMRQGYGKMLIDFSYLLSKVEEKVGSPERPLSDLGLISYRSYWKDVLLKYLNRFQGKEISIKEISQETAVNPVDIVSTLQSLQMLKYWKGKHLVLKRQDLIDDWKDKETKRGNGKTIDPSALKWTPPKGT